MKNCLLCFFLIAIHSVILAQKDTIDISVNVNQKSSIGDVQSINVSIYPVPVRDNNFTIESDKEISSIKITNIIGQDIFRIKYNTPQPISKVDLDNPQRGIYIVTIVFSDDTRVVRKILIEGYN
jgi:hypothetical protein